MHEVRKVLFLQESKQNGGWLTFEGDFKRRNPRRRQVKIRTIVIILKTKQANNLKNNTGYGMTSLSCSRQEG